MKIRIKIFLSIMSTAFFFFLVVLVYLSWSFRESLVKDAQNTADAFAMQSANLAKAQLDDAMATARTLKDVFSNYPKIEKNQRKELYIYSLKKVLETQPKFITVWMSWELSAIDPNWTKSYGRERIAVVRGRTGGIEVQNDTVNTEGDNYNSLYYKLKISKDDEFIMNPYFFKYSVGDFKDSVIETSSVIHIRNNNEFVGLIGIDIELSDLQGIISQESPFDTTSIVLMANDGTFVAHPQRAFVGKKFNEIYKNEYKDDDILKKIAAGHKFSLYKYDENGSKTAYSTFAPIYTGKTKTPWSIAVTVPIDLITESAYSSFFNAVYVGLIGFLFMTLVIYLISENITKPLRKFIVLMHHIDHGNIDLSYKVKTRRKDEIGEIADSLNKILDKLNITSNFAQKIGKGDFDAELESSGEHDILANALLEMRKNIQNSEIEREERAKEIEMQSWFQKGIAEIGDVLQENYSDLEVYLYKVLRHVVKYLKAVQGGFFILEDVGGIDKLVLKASYAYDKKKKLSEEFEIGESLVGRCALEKKTIYMKDIPVGYTFISSGLGDDNPRELIIVPLIHEQVIMGVLEIAGFNSLDRMQESFLEPVSQRIAAVLSNIKISHETSRLLEQFKKQSEELEKKDQETKETIERFERIQEDIKIREIEAKGIMDALVSVASVVFYDMDGTITRINQKNIEVFGIEKKDLIGKSQFDLFEGTDEEYAKLEEFWDNLRKGIPQEKEFYIKHEGTEMWLHENYTPILNKEGKAEKVINIGIDITDKKKMEQKLKS